MRFPGTLCPCASLRRVLLTAVGVALPWCMHFAHAWTDPMCWRSSGFVSSTSRKASRNCLGQSYSLSTFRDAATTYSTCNTLQQRHACTARAGTAAGMGGSLSGAHSPANAELLRAGADVLRNARRRAERRAAAGDRLLHAPRGCRAQGQPRHAMPGCWGRRLLHAWRHLLLLRIATASPAGLARLWVHIEYQRLTSLQSSLQVTLCAEPHAVAVLLDHR